MPETSTQISLIGPHAGMFDAWFALYERYAIEAGAQPNRRIGGTLWRWLLDGTYRVAGVIAVDNRKEIVGFAHYRPYPTTLGGTEACWLDDLYVADALRDSGLGRAPHRTCLQHGPKAGLERSHVVEHR